MAPMASSAATARFPGYVDDGGGGRGGEHGLKSYFLLSGQTFKSRPIIDWSPLGGGGSGSTIVFGDAASSVSWMDSDREGKGGS